MRRGILFLSFLLLGTFFFSADFARAAGPTIVPTTISKETTWTKENGPYIIQSNVYVQAKLTIEPGTVVKFWAAPYSLYINAEFSARGTKNERVVFTSIHDDSDGVDSDKDFTAPRPPQSKDWKTIYINPNFKIEFTNAAVRYGNVALWATSTGAEHENLAIRNSEISHAVTGIYMENVEPVIESNLIAQNSTGVIFFANSGLERKLTLSGNSFSGNGSKAVYGFNTNHSGQPCVNAKNNWWGDASGPKDPIGNPSGKGDAANSPEVVYDPWFKENPNVGLDPVIIIPGIMGSATKYPGGFGELKIDPILHTYDNLIAGLKKNGYKEGENLFEFPYEWRDSNIQNAQKLKEKIGEIKTKTGRPKVDIVAHSMGGLVARYYIEGENYGDDIDQLITLGTPHKGSPKSYLTWEAGEIGSQFDDNIVEGIFKIEANHSGYDTLKDYIQSRVVSVRELLPEYNYLKKASSGEMKNYPNNYPQNTFLEFLNSSERLKKLSNVEFINIIGDTKNNNTMEQFRVVDSDRKGIWEHGMPENYYNSNTDQGIEYGQGDETVPFSSAESIASDKKIILNSSHGNLPTEAQCNVYTELTGNQNCDKANVFDRVVNILTFGVFSPIDIQIESPSGKRIGKNFNTGEEFDEIGGAFYTGYETKNEFIAIPNPEDGEYKILTEGTGTGEYTIETAKITQDETTGQAVEATATITGTAEPEKIEENKIEINGDSLKKVAPLTLSPKNKNEENIIETTGIVLGATQDQSLTANSNDPKNKIRQLDDLKNSVRGYFKNGQIKTRKETVVIAKSLGHIRVHLKNYEILGKKSRISQKNILKAKKKANQHIDGLSVYIGRSSPKKIDEEARDDLTENIKNLKL